MSGNKCNSVTVMNGQWKINTLKVLVQIKLDGTVMMGGTIGALCIQG